MATLQELKDAIATLSTDIAAEKIEVQGLLTDLKTQIQVLTDQLAGGIVVTAADLQELLDSLTAIDAAVKGISEPTVPI